MTKVPFTSKKIAACTVYSRPEYEQMSFWKRDSTREATDKANWSPGFGHTIGDQSSSLLLLMLLEQNMWAKITQ